ncbi:MAG TPA: response regulator [Sphingomicrobium sp.]
MSSPASSTDRPDQPTLKGRRILIVEDSPVVGEFTAELLTELGCEVVGPAPNMASARELIDAEDLDAALMDVHIRGERVFALCELLRAKGVPFILTSGYGDWQLPEEWKDRPRLYKPYTIDQVRQALDALLADRPE